MKINNWKKRILDVCEGDPLAVTMLIICKEAIENARQEERERIENMLKNWDRFVCHTRKEHETIADDCPGWCAEDDKLRGVILKQILYKLQNL